MGQSEDSNIYDFNLFKGKISSLPLNENGHATSEDPIILSSTDGETNFSYWGETLYRGGNRSEKVKGVTVEKGKTSTFTFLKSG